MTEIAELVTFQREAARYFEGRNTGGEDRAHWANVFNAENCRKTADKLEALHRDNRNLVQHCAGRLEAAQMWQARALAAESRLAAMAPVVEAARAAVADYAAFATHGSDEMIALGRALAKLEAANV